MDSQSRVMTHQPSAIKVSPGRGILKQELMCWKLNSVMQQQSPCDQGSSPGSTLVGTAQEQVPQSRQGVIIGLEKTSTLTRSCEEK